MIHFNPIWSSLNKFDPIWKSFINLIKFELPFLDWSLSNIWSGCHQTNFVQIHLFALNFISYKPEITSIFTIKGNKHNKGDKQTKNIKCPHKSETEVITRRRALRSARLKKSKWPTQINWFFFNSSNSQYFFAKISGIVPWVSRIKS